MSAEPWSRAWQRAARAFWQREEPGGHFTTSAGPLIADRLALLVHDVDARLDHPRELTVIDIGCGRGELLALVRERCRDLDGRARWIGVDIRTARAPGIEAIRAVAPTVLGLEPIRGLVMAHEWLDEIACDIVERDDDGVDRLVLVDADGREIPGPALDDVEGCSQRGVDAPQARAWLRQWWPLREPGDRAEIGTERERAWQWMCGLVESGTVVATDYGHVHSERETLHRHGTLAGYRSGRIVRPAPDGDVNLTAHVAVDACAEAVSGTMITRQRDEIAAVRLGTEPAAAEVEGYFASLRLRDPGTWGDVHWLRWDA